MPAILITWAAVIPTFVGVGLLLRRLYGPRQTAAVQPIRAFWTGFAVSLAIAQAWSLFGPANARVWFVILPLGASGLAWSGRSLLRFAREAFRRPLVSLLIAAFLLLVAVRTAVSAAREVPFPDTGAYHLPATLWANTYAVVPGLSNLSCSLGLDSSLFPYAAMFSEGPWSRRPHHVVMGVLLLMLVAVSLAGALRLADRGRPRIADLLAVSYFVPAAYLLVLGSRVSSLSPNVAMMFLVLVAGWQIVIAVTSEHGWAHDSGYTSFCAGMLLVAASTIKITAAPFAAVALLVAYTAGKYGAKGDSRRMLLRSLAWLMIGGCLLAGAWLVRGVVINGYPFYPLPIAGIDADWKVPEQQAVIVKQWAESFGRRSHDRPPVGYEWLGPWASQMVNVLGFSIPFGAVVALCLCLPVLRFLPCSRSLDNPERRALRMVWPSLVALAAWFATAPDPRYAVGYIWLLACLLGSYLLARVWPYAWRVARPAAFAAVITIMTAEAVWFLARSGPSALAACRENPAGSLEATLTCGLLPLPGKFRTYVTRSGLELQVPVYGNGVWDAPLLSTPYPSANLKLRDPSDASRGFLSDGPWKPLRFPNEWDGFQRYVAERLGLESDELEIERQP